MPAVNACGGQAQGGQPHVLPALHCKAAAHMAGRYFQYKTWSTACAPIWTVRVTVWPSYSARRR